MSRLYDHLAGVVETADGGFEMTRQSRQYFSRFLRQHGRTLRNIATHAALIEVLRECNAADFAALRQRRHIDPIEGDHGRGGMVADEALHRMVA